MVWGRRPRVVDAAPVGMGARTAIPIDPTKPLANAKHEAFCQAYMKTAVACQACKAVYPRVEKWTRGSLDVEASRLRTSPEIAPRIASLQATAAGAARVGLAHQSAAFSLQPCLQSDYARLPGHDPGRCRYLLTRPVRCGVRQRSGTLRRLQFIPRRIDLVRRSLPPAPRAVSWRRLAERRASGGSGGPCQVPRDGQLRWRCTRT